MIIDFYALQEAHLEGFNGGEGEFIARIFQDPQNKILKGRLDPGASIGYHCHETSSEIIFVLEGRGSLLVNQSDSGAGEAVREPIGVGECHYCPRGSYHSLINDSNEPLIFFAVVCQQ